MLDRGHGLKIFSFDFYKFFLAPKLKKLSMIFLNSLPGNLKKN